MTAETRKQKIHQPEFKVKAGLEELWRKMSLSEIGLQGDILLMQHKNRIGGSA